MYNCEKCGRSLELCTVMNGKVEIKFPYWENQLFMNQTFHGSSTTFSQFTLDKRLCNECFAKIKDIVIKWYNNEK